MQSEDVRLDLLYGCSKPIQHVENIVSSVVVLEDDWSRMVGDSGQEFPSPLNKAVFAGFLPHEAHDLVPKASTRLRRISGVFAGISWHGRPTRPPQWGRRRGVSARVMLAPSRDSLPTQREGYNYSGWGRSARQRPSERQGKGEKGSGKGGKVGWQNGARKGAGNGRRAEQHSSGSKGFSGKFFVWGRADHRAPECCARMANAIGEDIVAANTASAGSMGIGVVRTVGVMDVRCGARFGMQPRTRWYSQATESSIADSIVPGAGGLLLPPLAHNPHASNKCKELLVKLTNSLHRHPVRRCISRRRPPVPRRGYA